MKRIYKLCLLFVLVLPLAVAAWLAPVSNPFELSMGTASLTPNIMPIIKTGVNLPWKQLISGDKVVLGGIYELKPGEILDGDLLIVGGNATLDEGSTVDGDVSLLGGALYADGMIDGSLFGLGGAITLSDTTQVTGDVTVIGSSLQGATSANVLGGINTSDNLVVPFQVSTPNNLRLPNLQVHYNPFWSLLWYLFQTFMWAALAVLVVLFLSRPVERVAHTASSQPLISGGLGLLTAILAPLVLILISITIIGIPLAIFLALALVVAGAYGFIAIGAEVGHRLGKMSKTDWAPAVSAGIGTFLLALIAFGIGRIPCIGWIVPFTIFVIGLGAVVLTRFGTQSYPTQPGGTMLAVEPTDSMQVTDSNADETSAGS